MNWINKNANIAYEMLVTDSSTEKLGGYCERHHIIPRSMGGTDDPENLVYVTARNHLFLHYWLWVGTGDQKLGHAYFSMANTNWLKYDDTPFVNESMVQAYEKARIAHAEASRERNTGKTHSVETRAKMSRSRSGKKNPMFGKTRSAETRAKISEKKTGNTGSLSPRSKKVLMKLDCGLVFSYGSAREAGRCLGKSHTGIAVHCRKGTKGFSYATNNDVSTTGADI
jgi:hypothetical protein